MSQEICQSELQEKTQKLLQGPLKHIRAAALAAALLPLASIAAAPASAQTACPASADRHQEPAIARANSTRPPPSVAVIRSSTSASSGPDAPERLSDPISS